MKVLQRALLLPKSSPSFGLRASGVRVRFWKFQPRVDITSFPCIPGGCGKTRHYYCNHSIQTGAGGSPWPDFARLGQKRRPALAPAAL